MLENLEKSELIEESITARIARKMGNILLTKTMDKVWLDLDYANIMSKSNLKNVRKYAIMSE